jgi:hypothetical protein
VNIEIRGSGFSAKSSDFLPPKWSKNAGFSDFYSLFGSKLISGQEDTTIKKRIKIKPKE